MSLKATNQLFKAVYYDPAKERTSYFEALGYKDPSSLYTTDDTVTDDEGTVLYEPPQRGVTLVGYENPGRSTSDLDPIMQKALDLLLSDPNIKNRIRVTSKRRAPRYEGDNSNHTRGLAFDIVPIDGDFDSLKRNIARNTQLVNYLNYAGLGIISEVTPEEQRRYRATGANLHFGPDSAALEGLKTIINKYKNEIDTQSETVYS